MDKKNEDGTEPVQPDLKHDNMEYAASTDGDDLLDVPDEQEDITADELDALEDDDIDDDAYALENAANDSLIDDDNFLAEPDEVDEFDEDKDDEVEI